MGGKKGFRAVFRRQVVNTPHRRLVVSTLNTTYRFWVLQLFALASFAFSCLKNQNSSLSLASVFGFFPTPSSKHNAKIAMNYKETQNCNTSIVSRPFSSISGPDSDWDPLFTDQDLQAIDAIEASFQPTSTSTSASSSSSSSSSTFKKRLSTPESEQYPTKNRRHLPISILSLPKAFPLSPCQASTKMRYPEMKFGGRILYSRTRMDVENAARELLQSLEVKKPEMDQVTLGFDIEWRPTFRRGALPGKVAVMQICADISYCHVMHIIHSGITESLQFLLEDQMLLKVGVGIGNDCGKVFKDYNVSVKAVEDLSYLANQKLGGGPRTWGLQSLTEMLFCKELKKPNKIRLGNWEVDVLSERQLEYAATDAFASWQLYQVLKSLPDSKDAAYENS